MPAVTGIGVLPTLQPTPRRNAAYSALCFPSIHVSQPPENRFKTHNSALPNRLTSSRSIENAPASAIHRFFRVTRLLYDMYNEHAEVRVGRDKRSHQA